MKFLMLLLVTVAALVSLPTRARAAEPLLSWQRFSVAAVAKQQYVDEYLTKAQFKVGVAVAYNVLPKIPSVSIGANVLQSVTTGKPEASILISIGIWRGKPSDGPQ